MQIGRLGVEGNTHTVYVRCTYNHLTAIRRIACVLPLVCVVVSVRVRVCEYVCVCVCVGTSRFTISSPDRLLRSALDHVNKVLER